MFGFSPSPLCVTRIKIDVIYSENGILCFSFGPQGGRHVDYVADQVVAKLIDVVKKKNKAGVAVKPFQVKLLEQ